MKSYSRSVLIGAVVVFISAAGYFLYTNYSCTYKAGDILEKTGIKGGLVVHVGATNGKLTAALQSDSGYIVHGLAIEEDQVRKAREYIKDQGLYGKVSVEQWNGKQLPYIDNMVNLLVAGESPALSMDEILRVLSPNGVAYIQKDGQWMTRQKSRTQGIDDWPQYLYDATNNAVSNDTLVGPPTSLQWVGSPQWTRHHDHMNSLSAMVSSNGRIFYIMDEGPISSILLPSDWKLIARDAFNGIVLWKKDISEWVHWLWDHKSGPAQLPRRLVAMDDKLFVTLSIDGPVKKLDAVSGRVLKTYEHTASTEEILYSKGILYLLVNKQPRDSLFNYQKNLWRESFNEVMWKGREKHVMAIDQQSGRCLWETKSPVLPLTLTVDDSRLYFHDGNQIQAYNRTSGKKLWENESVSRASEIRSFFAPMLVVHDDVVLFAEGREASQQMVPGGDSKGNDQITALSAKTGKVLWRSDHPLSGYRSPEDIFVIDDVVWMDNRLNGKFTGRKLHTGEIVSEFGPDSPAYWFHHRCFRNKATQKTIMTARTGMEFVYPSKEQYHLNHWVRGTCVYGIMPANGLTYAPPDPCACYPEAKLTGFNALSSTQPSVNAREDQDPLVKGPAYQSQSQPGKNPGEGEWPTYRHDMSRGGYVQTRLPAKLKTHWNTAIGGKLTSLVLANNTIYVARKNIHTLYALDASNGKQKWHFTAGGRIDSPPSIYKGRVIFGSADGWIYCLDEDNGALVWKFHAAPNHQKIVSYGQLESLWPVSGNVLVQDGEVWFVAGRSMFLDSGLYLYRLDATTGEEISRTHMDNINPQTGKDLQLTHTHLTMAVTLPDILSSGENCVYMRSQKFNLKGERMTIKPIPGYFSHREFHYDKFKNLFMDSATSEQTYRHLFSPYGFLDDSWFHRSYWVYGSHFLGGWNGYYMAGRYQPSGRIMVYDKDCVYGFGRQSQYYRWTTPMEYQLFSNSKSLKIDTTVYKGDNRRNKDQIVAEPMPYKWNRTIPILVRGMVLAHNTLFISGPPDLVNEEEALRNHENAQIQSRLNMQKVAMQGKKGALLWAVDSESGTIQTKYQIDSPPVWDGLIAAKSKLFMATMDGKVICWGE